MEATPTTSVEMPDQEAVEGVRIDTSSAFGSPGGLAKDPQTQMAESNVPTEGDGSRSGSDETLKKILNGEVPTSGAR